MMALTKLRGLIRDNMSVEESTEDEYDGQPLNRVRTRNYEDWGFEKAGHLNGSEMGLLQCLARIREDHKRMVRRDELKQSKLKEPLVVMRENKLTQINHKEAEMKRLEDTELPALENKVENLQKEIIAIKKNPEELLPDKMSKVSFAIGLLILLALSIYLFIFYSSASFSAFFKEFSLNNIGVANSIFDPQAISRASQDGVTELILIVSMPFVFIGLGFLIHKFQEQQGIGKFFKIAFLVLVTFVFDAILAYEITEKIYNIKAENSFQEMPEYNFDLAFQDVNFWLIIFAGFVVYLIWGFVFDFTIEAYDKINVVKQAINAKKSEIDIYRKQISDKKSILQSLTSAINTLKVECAELKVKMDGVIIDTAEFDKILHEFLGGWTHWMSVNKKDQQDIDHVTKKANEFIAVNVRSLEMSNYSEL